MIQILYLNKLIEMNKRHFNDDGNAPNNFAIIY